MRDPEEPMPGDLVHFVLINRDEQEHYAEVVHEGLGLGGNLPWCDAWAVPYSEHRTTRGLLIFRSKHRCLLMPLGECRTVNIVYARVSMGTGWSALAVSKGLVS